MQNVKLRVSDLLEKIKANRDSHRELFLKAQEGYRAQVIEELDKMLADARAGKKVRRIIGLPEPEDHTSDYDRVIQMLEMCTEETVELDHDEFDNFVRDNWRWKEDWNSTNSRYWMGA
jgi:hypothetical protein